MRIALAILLALALVLPLSHAEEVGTASGLSCYSPLFSGVCAIGGAGVSYGGHGAPAVGTVISIFGDPREGHSHQGIDIQNRPGTPIRAFEAGVVDRVNSADTGLCGKEASVVHSDGLRTIYCHLDSVGVQSGQRVEQGQQVGTMGNTGNARNTVTHLHFEIRHGGAPLDPCTLLACGRGTHLV